MWRRLNEPVVTRAYRKRAAKPLVPVGEDGQPLPLPEPEALPALVEVPAQWVERRPVRPCRVHGLTLCLPGSPVCAHPQCVERMVRSMGYRFGYIGNAVRLLDQKCLVGDFVSSLLEAYLRHYRARRNPMIRPQWVAWQASAFLRKKHTWGRNETLIEPSMEVRGGTFVYENEMDVDYLGLVQENASAALSDGEYGGLRKYLEVRELADRVVETGGAMALLVLREDITLADSWLLDERKREMGQSLAQRALEVEFVRCWVSLWAKYRSREASDGGRSDDSAGGDDDGRGTDGGYWPCWDGEFRLEEAFGARAKPAAGHSKQAEGRGDGPDGRGHGDVGAGAGVGPGAVGQGDGPGSCEGEVGLFAVHP